MTGNLQLFASMLKEALSLLRLQSEATVPMGDRIKLWFWRLLIAMLSIALWGAFTKAHELFEDTVVLKQQVADLMMTCQPDLSKNKASASSDSDQSGQGLKPPIGMLTSTSGNSQPDCKTANCLKRQQYGLTTTQ